MTNTELSALLAAQQTTNRLLVIMATRGLRQKEAIALLDRTGLQPKEIAKLLGTTSNTVSVALASIRKAGKTKKNRQSTSNVNES